MAVRQALILATNSVKKLRPMREMRLAFAHFLVWIFVIFFPFNSMGTAYEASRIIRLLLDERGDDKYVGVVVSADKGLAGAFNASIINATRAFPKEGRES